MCQATFEMLKHTSLIKKTEKISPVCLFLLFLISESLPDPRGPADLQRPVYVYI